MNINQLVAMAQRIHDLEGYKLGSSSTREYRNAFWARVIGCAYWGHSIYNANPDTQWHLKNAGGGRPQTDDVATSMPSRAYWDCIAGVGADGYRFTPTGHAEPLSLEQEVYPPPKPADSGTGGGGGGENPEPDDDVIELLTAILAESKANGEKLTGINQTLQMTHDMVNGHLGAIATNTGNSDSKLDEIKGKLDDIRQRMDGSFSVRVRL